MEFENFILTWKLMHQIVALFKSQLKNIPLNMSKLGFFQGYRPRSVCLMGGDWKGTKTAQENEEVRLNISSTGISDQKPLTEDLQKSNEMYDYG